MAACLRSPMLVGILFALGANLLWGLALVIPKLLSNFTSIEIILGRYLSYGIASLCLLFTIERPFLRNYSWHVWLAALIFAFTGHIGYYFCVVSGIKYIGAPTTTLVLGIVPVTVSLYGNLRRREYPFTRLFTPIVLIFIGLIIVNIAGNNWNRNLEGITVIQRVVGLLSSFSALILWTWYGVANSIFLKAHPDLRSSTWSTLVGVFTLFWVLVITFIMAFSGNGLASLERFTRLDSEFLHFLIGSLILGIAASWGATLLWNLTCALLPVSLAGQLIVLETIAGLTYVFISDFKLPSAFEFLGIIMSIVGVLLGINTVTKITREADSRRT